MGTSSELQLDHAQLPLGGTHRRLRERWLRAGLLVLLLSLLASPLLANPPAEAAPTLVKGFSLRDLPSGQAELLTDFAYVPLTGSTAMDGSYFTTGKNGRVAWVSAAGTAKTLATLSVITRQDLGLVSVAVASDYETSKRIYTIRTVSEDGTWYMRLSAWTVTGGTTPTGLSDERTVLQLTSGQDFGTHALTGILPQPDGTLWVSIGDNASYREADPRAYRALDVNQGYGKLLHILPNGNGVPANPYYDPSKPSAWKSRVYASGFRSPFRIAIDPATGAPIVADVGMRDYEEVNLVRAGASYGWPCWEGTVRTPVYKDAAQCKTVTNIAPLWRYEHGPLGTSITGGLIYTGNSYPAAYRGSYFFGDYGSDRIYTLKYDKVGKLTRAPEANGFGREIGAPVKFAAAANGDIVYADIATSKLRRLVYAEGNRAPTARASISNDPDTRTVTFDASTSTDLDGDVLSFAWDFGDGATGKGAKVTHKYATGKTSATVKLTVKDPVGDSDVATYTVVPGNHTPELKLSTPGTDATFAVGDAVKLGATATDTEDGSLDVKWQVVLVHCSGGYCHDHPGDGGSGGTFSQDFDDHGDDTRMEIVASATDQDGAVAQKVYVAKPRQHTLTIKGPVASAITVNGTPAQTVELTVGARAALVAPTTASDGVATFDRWADGAPREREITMPDSDLTLTAVYLTPIDRRYADDADLRAVVGTPRTAEAGDASLRYRDYTKARVYWTRATGVHEMHGKILSRYKSAGGPAALGAPTTDEVVLANGRYNELYGPPNAGARSAAIYWSSKTDAHVVQGSIYKLWKSLGAEKSKHGYPVADEAAIQGGRLSRFSNGSIYWRSSVGARSVHGAIFQKWKALGASKGVHGFPMTNETKTADGVGRYNNFQRGSIYWKPGVGAKSVRGVIHGRWKTRGAEKSYLGYPTSDEFAISGGRRSNFEHGYITWNSTTKKIVDRRY